MNREAFVSAMKRKDVKALGALILRDVYDEPERAKELEDATRLTIPLIDRTCILESCGTTKKHRVEESGEQTVTEENTSAAEEAIAPINEAKAIGGVDLDKDRAVFNIGEIKAMLEKGDKKSFKKAKKAFEAQFAEDHPNYKELKKLIKEAKKALK